jgi:hypothetical protein
MNGEALQPFMVEFDERGGVSKVLRGRTHDPVALLAADGCGAWSGYGGCNAPATMVLRGGPEIHYRCYRAARSNKLQANFAVVCDHHATGEEALTRDMPPDLRDAMRQQEKADLFERHQLGPRPIRATPIERGIHG